MSAVKETGLPVNYGWYTSQQHNYKPRGVSAEIHAALAELALLADQDFQQLVSDDCDSSWVVSIQVGRDTLHLSVYTGEELYSRQRCTERDFGKEALFMVSRAGKLRTVFQADMERIATSYPRYYSVRTLTPVEVESLNAWQRTFERDGVDVGKEIIAQQIQRIGAMLDSTPAHH